MDRFREREFEVLEAIQKSSDKGLYFEALVRLGNHDALQLYRTLKKFVARNILSERNTPEGAYFYISSTNETIILFRVKCPICNTERRATEDQQTVHCANKNCTLPTGKHRNFWLVNVDHFRKGEVIRINCLEAPKETEYLF
jgi:Fe2+ or Zn2+ uptake regulation protein